MIVFVGTIGELRQILQHCRDKKESIVIYARKHGPRGGKVMKYEGTIAYMITENHPNRKYVKDIGKTFTYSDTFTFDQEFPREVVEDYIKRELALVAGGGYDTEHIYNVKVKIKKID